MVEKRIRSKFESLRLVLSERQRRLWAASEAEAIGRGGISIVSRATGLSRTTIRAGRKEMREIADRGEVEYPDRIRRPGAGRPPLEKRDPDLVVALDILIEPQIRGGPDSPLRWTCKSVRKLATELTQLGHPVSPQKVSELLKAQGYCLLANKKRAEGAHPDRKAQFEHIAQKCEAFQLRGQPVISVDTKRKELVEPTKPGRELRPGGGPDSIRAHDFIDRGRGELVPYGVYDIVTHEDRAGTDHDTPELTVATLRRWWKKVGWKTYPEASEILVTADAGGSKSYGSRLWKARLQEFADESGLKITVSHFPPGTSKWNKIEHRMFSFISMSWRGQPLLIHEVMVSLIGNTVNRAGDLIVAQRDAGEYPLGVKGDAAHAKLGIKRSRFHGDWNYTIVQDDDTR